jgi:hypothetical protein
MIGRALIGCERDHLIVWHVARHVGQTCADFSVLDRCHFRLLFDLSNQWETHLVLVIQISR